MVDEAASDAVGRRAVLTAAAGALAFAATPFGVRSARAQERPIRIGFPTPLTGPYGAEAQNQVAAAQLAVAQFNEAGGLAGRQAELLVRDDKLNPGEAATRTLELIESEKVDFIVGGLSASVQLAVNNITRERKVLFNSISQSDVINEAKDFSRYTFHEALNPHMTAGAVGRYAFGRFGKRVVYLTADYAYGHEMVRGFQAVGDAMGVMTLADISHPIGTTDFSTLMPRIQALKPDILCLCNFGRDQQIAVKQAADFGLKRNIKIITPILVHTARVAGGPAAFEGVVGGTSYYWGLESTIPTAKSFNDAFRQRNGGRVPTDYGSMAYGGVRSVLAAVKAAGTADTERVVDALQALRYDFYKGPEYYRACDHQAVQSVFIITSKSKDMASPEDVFSVLSTEAPDELHLRSCAELGHA
ncbi:ABC transporter substrate-binding protein [Lichenibacterium dinghuense]|uniref:ABC transporter substrate-binding protein n=1 Tax=Lichenibacterium dinghuense TaxID=2895977 RepID=UPI001F418205|nr:ABC transporter substrate-binding protein [Lichenibacterium sp. 6Y81]